MEVIASAFAGAVMALLLEHFWECRRARRLLHDWIGRTDGQIERSLNTHRSAHGDWVEYQKRVHSGGSMVPQPPNTIHYARVTDIEQFVLEHYLAVPQSAAFLMLVLNSACRDADLEIDGIRAYAASFANEVRDPEAPGTREWVLRVAEHMIYRLAGIVRRLESAKRAMFDLRADAWAP